MSLALHVAAKDLRAHRALLAAWGASLLADLALSTGWAHRAVFLSPLGYDIARLVVSPVTTLLGAFVAIGAIHADPSVSTTALWMTRPVGRRTLLAAKLTVTALAILVTALEQQLAAALAGARGNEAWLVLVEALFVQALIVLPLAALATLTRDAGRYLLALVAALAALPLVHAVLVATVRGRLLDPRPVPALLTAAGLLLASSLAVMAHQMLTRKTWRSSVLAAASAVLVLVVFDSFLPSGRGAARPAAPGASGLPIDTRPEIQAHVGSDGLRRAAAGRDRVRLLADFELTGLPTNVVAVPRAVRASWAVPGSSPVESREIGFPGGWWHEGVPNQPRFREAIGRLLGAEVLEPPETAGSGRRALEAGVGFDASAIEARVGKAGSLTLDVELLLVRLREAGRMPLRPGEMTRAGAHHLVVLPERPEFPGVRVSDLRPALFLDDALRQRPPAGLSLVALDAARRQAAVPRGVLVEPSFGGGLSHVRHRTVSLGYAPQVDAEWLAGADLVAVALEPQGMIRRVVRLEGTRFEDVPALDGRGL